MDTRQPAAAGDRGVDASQRAGPGLPAPFVFHALADAMHRAWVACVADGDCGWPACDPARRRTMRFDTARHVVEDPLAAARARWNGAR